jgi:hypothetical protein
MVTTPREIPRYDSLPPPALFDASEHGGLEDTAIWTPRAVVDELVRSALLMARCG